MTKVALLDEKKNISFWLAGSLLVALMTMSLTRDLNRPFIGLHSWAEASSAWVARAHVNYGFGYTKGACTWAVGNPPAQNPERYWDHPQLANIILSLGMQILGTGESTIRISKTLYAVAALLIFLKLVKDLTDERTSLLAGLFFVIFPIVQYFGVEGSLLPLALASVWFYLKLIGIKDNKPEKLKRYYFGLAITTFLGLILGWAAFFFAMAVGIHYVFHCMHRKTWPDKLLLTILITAPFLALVMNFTIMAAGYNWDVQKIVDLYKWRASKGERPEFIWSEWFATFWKHAVTNYTIPVLLFTIVYLTVGQLFVFAKSNDQSTAASGRNRFPQFCLFLMPWVFQLLILRGCLWQHQSWESPMSPFLAIACALGVLTLRDVIAKINLKASNIAAVSLVAILFIVSIYGGNHYYGMQWQPLEKIKMFKTLNQVIPPDKALLSFEDFIVNQNEAKGGFYRPEYAYYLDREITSATSLEEIEKYAASGKYPYYLVPNVPQLAPLTNKLYSEYSLFRYIPDDPGETKNGAFFKAGMMPYLIFDLQNKRPANR
ncbi:MAG: glycosyltransferase family 39 protein [Phycisphaerales bacterium]